MANELRLIVDGPQPAARNMAVDEAILLGGVEAIPTLRLYAWSPAAVSLGYFQSAGDELDLTACRSEGVTVVRRITGGGAVFHDAELTYSLVLPAGHPLGAGTILESYERICTGVVAGLAKLGIAARFAPLNDVVTANDIPQKLGGQAQTRKHGGLLQHGTVLLGVDVERMFRLLQVADEKMRGKLIRDVRQRVTSAEQILGREVGFGEAAAAMQAGFVEALDLTLTPASLTADEQKRIPDLLKKYASDEWVMRR
ncbi:MAG: lipoate--protein ligase family protein [Alphaproteobacteria bacterium CG_4_10_14_0_2_um_filter_63_37]|nr:MAG: lipoate--protein ligase [Proteobacteria bacterium CG1_02_64_396]PJA23814.1 MAG: lipoate--protein ligase family protein [Alphaproteobacteria bacterium CG_4_10_14_0_2_um_filter_63_37]